MNWFYAHHVAERSNSCTPTKSECFFIGIVLRPLVRSGFICGLHIQVSCKCDKQCCEAGREQNLRCTTPIQHCTLTHTHTLTLSVFLAPSLLLMTIVLGPPMEQMFFSRAPPQTGTVDTAKSWRHAERYCDILTWCCAVKPPLQCSLKNLPENFCLPAV